MSLRPIRAITPPRGELRPAPPKLRSLTPKQKEVIRRLRTGWRVMHVQTSFSSSVSGSMNFTWGERLVSPSGTAEKVDYRLFNGLKQRGILETVEARVSAAAARLDDLGTFLREQNTPRETMRLTEKGKTVDL